MQSARKLPPLPQASGREKPKLHIGWEPFKDVVQEALPLIERHYANIGLDQPFDPDWQAMLFVAAQGRFVVLTVRNDEGRLVGYCAGNLVNTIGSKDARLVLINAIYLEKAYRGPLGVPRQLLALMEAYGRKNGAFRMEFGPQGPMRKGIARLLGRLGWKPSPDPAFIKDL